MNPANITITDLEKKLLENFATNEYCEFPHSTEIWSDCWDCGKNGAFITKAQVRGVIASLSKKGLVNADIFCGKDSTMSLTGPGMALIQSMNLTDES